MRRAHTICAYLVITLGLVHVALTGHACGAWVSPRALFFVGSGLGIVLLGFTNLVFLRAVNEPLVRALCRASNVVGVAFFTLGAIALPQPQVFALLALVLAQTGMGFVTATKRHRRATPSE
jgi:hypothetical protein